MKRTELHKLIYNDHGFTLTELLVVLIIVGILVVLAVPRFDAVVNRTKMTEAKLMLKQVYSLEDAHHMEHDTYTTDLASLGFQQEKLTTEGGNARYRIAIASATDTSFTATATSVVDFDDDGTFNVWKINHRQELKQATPD